MTVRHISPPTDDLPQESIILDVHQDLILSEYALVIKKRNAEYSEAVVPEMFVRLPPKKLKAGDTVRVYTGGEREHISTKADEFRDRTVHALCLGLKSHLWTGVDKRDVRVVRYQELPLDQ